MDNITIGQVIAIVVALASFITACGVIYKAIAKRALKALQNGLEPTNKKIDSISNRITDVELSNCKNYIVDYLGRIECVGDYCPLVTPEQTQRFWECYDRYTELGGNSYIHEKVEKLKKDNKL